MKIWKYICKIVNAYVTCVACFHLFIKYPYLLACQPFIIHKWHNKAQKHENSKGSKGNEKMGRHTKNSRRLSKRKTLSNGGSKAQLLTLDIKRTT